jgi:hypothetical protein
MSYYDGWMSSDRQQNAAWPISTDVSEELAPSITSRVNGAG